MLTRTGKATIEDILKFMKKEIKTTKVPYVPWSKLRENAVKIIGEDARNPVATLWNLIEDNTTTIAKGETSPKVSQPRIYEYKAGNTWVYSPCSMIDLYVNSDGL